MAGSKKRRMVQRSSRYVYRKPYYIAFSFRPRTEPKRTEDMLRKQGMVYGQSQTLSTEACVTEPDSAKGETSSSRHAVSTSSEGNELKTPSKSFFSLHCSESDGFAESTVEITTVKKCPSDYGKKDSKNRDVEDGSKINDHSLSVPSLTKTSQSCAAKAEGSIKDIHNIFFSCVDSPSITQNDDDDEEEEEKEGEEEEEEEESQSCYEKKKREILLLMETEPTHETIWNYSMKSIEELKGMSVQPHAFKPDTQKNVVPSGTVPGMFDSKGLISNLAAAPSYIHTSSERDSATSTSVKTARLGAKAESRGRNFMNQMKEETWSEIITGKVQKSPSPFADLWRSELERASVKADYQTMELSTVNKKSLQTSTVEFISFTTESKQSKQQTRDILEKMSSITASMDHGDTTQVSTGHVNHFLPTETKESSADTTVEDDATSEGLDQALESQLDDFIQSTKFPPPVCYKSESTQIEDESIVEDGRKRHQRSYLRREREMAGATVTLSEKSCSVKAKSWIVNECPESHGEQSRETSLFRADTVSPNEYSAKPTERCEPSHNTYFRSSNLLQSEDRSHKANLEMYQSGSEGVGESSENYVSVEDDAGVSSPTCHSAISELDHSTSASLYSLSAAYITPISDTLETLNNRPKPQDSLQSPQITQFTRLERDKSLSRYAKDALCTNIIPPQRGMETKEEWEENSVQSVDPCISPAYPSTSQTSRDGWVFQSPGKGESLIDQDNKQLSASIIESEAQLTECSSSNLSSELCVDDPATINPQIYQLHYGKSFTAPRFYFHSVQSPFHSEQNMVQTPDTSLQRSSMDTECGSYDPISLNSSDSPTSVRSLPDELSLLRGEFPQPRWQRHKHACFNLDVKGNIMKRWTSQMDFNMSYSPRKSLSPESDVSLSLFSIRNADDIGEMSSYYHEATSMRTCVSVTTETCSSRSRRFNSTEDFIRSFPHYKPCPYRTFDGMHNELCSSTPEPPGICMPIESVRAFPKLSLKPSKDGHQESPSFVSVTADHQTKGDNYCWLDVLSPSHNLLQRSQSAPSSCQVGHQDDEIMSLTFSPPDKIQLLSALSEKESLTTGSISPSMKPNVDEQTEEPNSFGTFSYRWREDQDV